ncbi:MAG: DUF1610 domain-containing protein [Candidatus Thermoplasmatota archaeon]|nr:DUF1610 domain-containing protein [Candidatus Thermoplasmatota archaeon]
MRKADRCISCGKGLLEQGSTTFQCPTCDTIVGRCESCREQSIKYICRHCSFSGP